MYTVNENAGAVEISLILSNPSSTVVSVQVFDTNVTAYGKHIRYYASYINLSTGNVININLTFKLSILI